MQICPIFNSKFAPMQKIDTNKVQKGCKKGAGTQMHKGLVWMDKL